MKLRQPLAKSAEKLFEISETIPVIDTHEHILVSEKDYNKQTLKFGNLFNPYVSTDLFSAGMPFPREKAPVYYCIGDDWDEFEPYWNAVKFGSYARPVRIALQEFLGVDDFTRENYLEIVKKINENNSPGIYERVFKDKCHIEKCILCMNDLPDRNDPILLGNIHSPAMQVGDPAQLKRMAKEVEVKEVKSLDELVEVSDRWMELQVERGAIEFKARALPVQVPDKRRAEEGLKLILKEQHISEDMICMIYQLMAYIREANARKATELNVPIALHTGVWNDYRTLSVNDLIGFIKRNPDTKMDIYHLGIPEVRNAIQIVKNFPNAYLNLCWAHVVASDMVVGTLKEAIDMVPINKIFAFGADYIMFIEKVYGHLLMARENISIVLGDRVDRNLIDMSEAEAILRAWFYENPKKFYQIS